jgi:hypothetical protein
MTGWHEALSGVAVSSAEGDQWRRDSPVEDFGCIERSDGLRTAVLVRKDPDRTCVKRRGW